MEPWSRARWLTWSGFLPLALILPIALSVEAIRSKSYAAQSAAPSQESFPVGAPAEPRFTAEAPTPLHSQAIPDIDEAIRTARSLGMPKLAAYLARQRGESTRNARDKSDDGPAPAPEPLNGLSGNDGEAPGPKPLDADSKDDEPYFKGKPLVRTEADKKLYAKIQKDQAKARAEGKPVPVTFPIIYLDQLYNLNDLEADEIFSMGTAEVPSDIAKHNFAYCNQDTTLTLSWEKPTNWPRVAWPEADMIFNDIARAFWHGKWFVTDPVTKDRKLFNIIFVDDAVGFVTDVNYVDPGFHPDHKPSFVVNYSNIEVTLGKPALDEFRRVGPTIFLGSGVFYIDLHKFLAQYPQPWTQALLTTFGPLIDFASTTLTNTDNAIRALRNQSDFTNLRYPPEQFMPFSAYFAVDCQDYRTPPMHYLPVWSDGFTAFNNFWGWNPPGYNVPPIPGEYTDPDWGSTSTPKFSAPPFKDSKKQGADWKFPPDPNSPSTGLKFNTSADRVDPFVLLPYTMPANTTAGTPERQGFLQLPSKSVEPLFRNFWDSVTANPPLPEYPSKGAPASSPTKKPSHERNALPIHSDRSALNSSSAEEGFQDLISHPIHGGFGRIQPPASSPSGREKVADDPLAGPSHSESPASSPKEEIPRVSVDVPSHAKSPASSPRIEFPRESTDVPSHGKSPTSSPRKEVPREAVDVPSHGDSPASSPTARGPAESRAVPMHGDK
eukprot:jgi/Botrbrau1/5210/Bobra.0172s0074.1